MLGCVIRVRSGCRRGQIYGSYGTLGKPGFVILVLLPWKSALGKDEANLGR